MQVRLVADAMGERGPAAPLRCQKLRICSACEDVVVYPPSSRLACFAVALFWATPATSNKPHVCNASLALCSPACLTLLLHVYANWWFLFACLHQDAT
jgi:hypothetical protein